MQWVRRMSCITIICRSLQVSLNTLMTAWCRHCRARSRGCWPLQFLREEFAFSSRRRKWTESARPCRQAIWRVVLSIICSQCNQQGHGVYALVLMQWSAPQPRWPCEGARCHHDQQPKAKFLHKVVNQLEVASVAGMMEDRATTKALSVWIYSNLTKKQFNY